MARPKTKPGCKRISKKMISSYCGIRYLPSLEPVCKNKLRQVGVAFSSGKSRFDAVFECECGNLTVARVAGVADGNTTSCGCYGDSVRSTHGDTHAREYRIWKGMKQRCENTKGPAYAYYGGRGIVVCERWQDYGNFLIDMGRSPTAGHSVDRIDNDGPYAPWNCRWATKAEQAKNTRKNVYVVAFGDRQIVSDWERDVRCKASSDVFMKRIRAGWSPELAITTAPKFVGRGARRESTLEASK